MAKDEELNWDVRAHLTNERATHRRFCYGQQRIGGRFETRLVVVQVVLVEDGTLRLFLQKQGNNTGRLVLEGKLEVSGNQVVLKERGNRGFQADAEERMRQEVVINGG